MVNKIPTVTYKVRAISISWYDNSFTTILLGEVELRAVAHRLSFVHASCPQTTIQHDDMQYGWNQWYDNGTVANLD